MKMVYVLMQEVWGGNGYGYYCIEVHSSKTTAKIACEQYQIGHQSCDVRYYLEEVEMFE